APLSRVAGRMVNQDGNAGSGCGARDRAPPVAGAPVRAPARAPRPRSTGGTHPHRASAGAKRGNPIEVWPAPVSRPQGRLNPSVGTGWSQKRRPPAERQGESITRWIGPLGPRRKAADGDQVSHPKGAVKAAHRGTS